MGAGDTDGIDSNGDLIISGGSISVNAVFPFDYAGSVSFTGGTVTVNGEEVSSIENQSFGGGPGGFGGMGQRPGGMGGRPEGFEPPEGFDPSQGFEPPEGFDPSQGFGGGHHGKNA